MNDEEYARQLAEQFKAEYEAELAQRNADTKEMTQEELLKLASDSITDSDYAMALQLQEEEEQEERTEPKRRVPPAHRNDLNLGYGFVSNKNNLCGNVSLIDAETRELEAALSASKLDDGVSRRFGADDYEEALQYDQEKESLDRAVRESLISSQGGSSKSGLKQKGSAEHDEQNEEKLYKSLKGRVLGHTDSGDVITKHTDVVSGRRNARVLERKMEKSGDLSKSVLSQSALSSLQRFQAKQQVKGMYRGRVGQEEIATHQGVLDLRVELILFKLLNSGRLTEVLGVLRTGKEANVYLGTGWNHELHAQLALEENWAGPRAQVWQELLSSEFINANLLRSKDDTLNTSVGSALDEVDVESAQVATDDASEAEDSFFNRFEEEEREQEKAAFEELKELRSSISDVPDSAGTGEAAFAEGLNTHFGNKLHLGLLPQSKESDAPADMVLVDDDDEFRDLPGLESGAGPKVEPLKERSSDVAIKIFRTTLNEFKNRMSYVAGDRRYLHNLKRQNPRKIIELWAEKEFKNLVRIHRAGIPSPAPFHLKGPVLVMSFIGKDGWPAPRLQDTIFSSPARAFGAYVQVAAILCAMYLWCHLVHADASAYNLLYFRKRVYVIDVGQAVDTSHHNALRLLERDAENVRTFFSRILADESLLTVDDFISVVRGNWKFGKAPSHPGSHDSVRTGSRNAAVPMPQGGILDPAFNNRSDTNDDENEVVDEFFFHDSKSSMLHEITERLREYQEGRS